MIFERTFSKKILSCALPFHIAWHNFISTQPALLESILLYEPIWLEDVYLHFKNLGYKYHIQVRLTTINTFFLLYFIHLFYFSGYYNIFR